MDDKRRKNAGKAMHVNLNKATIENQRDKWKLDYLRPAREERERTKQLINEIYPFEENIAAIKNGVGKRVRQSVYLSHLANQGTIKDKA